MMPEKGQRGSAPGTRLTEALLCADLRGVLGCMVNRESLCLERGGRTGQVSTAGRERARWRRPGKKVPRGDVWGLALEGVSSVPGEGARQ